MNSAGTVLVALAALCWGLSGGIGAVLLEDGWSPYVVSLFRGAIGLLFVLVWLLIRSAEHGLKNSSLWFWSVIAGIGVAGNFAFYFVSIAQGSVAVAATLMYCAPVFVYLISFTLGIERPTRSKWIAIMLVMLGIVLLTRVYNEGAESVTVVGVVAGLLSGLSYAAFIFGFKYASPHGTPQAILVVAFTTLVAILAWPSGTGQTIAAITSRSWPLFVSLGVFGAGLSFILYVVGLKQTAPALASIVAMVEPVTASVFGYVVLDQRLFAPQLFGMVLILSTVTTLSIQLNRR